MSAWWRRRRASFLCSRFRLLSTDFSERKREKIYNFNLYNFLLLFLNISIRHISKASKYGNVSNDKGDKD